METNWYLRTISFQIFFLTPYHISNNEKNEIPFRFSVFIFIRITWYFQDMRLSAKFDLESGSRGNEERRNRPYTSSFLYAPSKYVPLSLLNDFIRLYVFKLEFFFAMRINLPCRGKGERTASRNPLRSCRSSKNFHVLLIEKLLWTQFCRFFCYRTYKQWIWKVSYFLSP